jgi:hypothetical protein
MTEKKESIILRKNEVNKSDSKMAYREKLKDILKEN